MGNIVRKEPLQQELLEWFAYDPNTGFFTWIKDPAPRSPGRHLFKRAGGTVGGGRWAIGFRTYGQVLAHRLAWIYVNGFIPAGTEIDHINGNPKDNRIENLRLASSAEQKRNRVVQSNNACGLKGAYIHRPRAEKGRKNIWRSQIKVGNRLIYLGWFPTAELAHAAYKKAAAEHFGEFACFGER